MVIKNHYSKFNSRVDDIFNKGGIEIYFSSYNRNTFKNAETI